MAIDLRIRVVLVRSRNALNMGAAARAMANFGLDDLVLVTPYVEAWDRARSARAGTSLLQRARVFDSLAEAVDDCGLVIGTAAGTDRKPEVPLEDWPALAASLPRNAALPTALVFGSEKTGLSVDDISHCQRLARIPTEPGAPSMNLGQAVAVCAYELARMRTFTEASAVTKLTAGERERLVETWQPLLEQLGVSRPEHRLSETRRLRVMLNRWRLERSDAERLFGVARQLRHALMGAGPGAASPRHPLDAEPGRGPL